MKKIALLLALALSFSATAVADARPGSTSFRGGFSSQKSNMARSAPAPQRSQPSFGSFGGRPAAPPPAAPKQAGSAMARDMDSRAAQDKALRNYDARRGAVAGAAGVGAAGAAATAAHGATPPLPPLNPVLPGGGNNGSNGNNNGSGGYNANPAPDYGRQAHPPVIVQERSSNNWLWGLGGYMLGRSVGATPQPRAETYPAGAGSTAAGGAVQSDSAAVAVQEKERPSLLRTLTWVALVSVLVWLAVRWIKRSQEKKNANYSFERN